MDDKLRKYMTGDARPAWMKRTILGAGVVCAIAASGLFLKDSPAVEKMADTTKTMASHAMERIASMRPADGPSIAEDAVVEDITTTSSTPQPVRVNRPAGQVSRTGAKRIQLDMTGASVDDKPSATAREGF